MKQAAFLLLALITLNLSVSAQRFSDTTERNHYYLIHTSNRKDSGALNESRYIIQLKTLDKTNKPQHFQCTFLFAERKTMGKRGYHFTSGDINSVPPHTTACLPVISILNKPIVITMGKEGEGYLKSDTHHLIEKAGEAWGFSSQSIGHLKQNLSALLSGLFSKIMFTVPVKDISQNAAWLSQDSSLAFQIKRLTSDSIIISSNKRIDQKNWKVKGRYVINRKTGALLSSERQDNRLVQGNGSRDVPLVKRITVKELTSLPEINSFNQEDFQVRMIMSFFSDSLKTGVEYDSLKIFRFLAANNAEYGNDSAYVVNKLRLLQAANNYKVYSKQLLATPNWVIRHFSIHLFNKLQNVYGKNPDSALSIIRYFYNTQGFNNWVQGSYAQAFRPSLLSSERRKNADSLLTLLLKEKDSLYYYTLKPLQLWSASQRTSDSGELMQIAAAFESLGRKSLWLGRSARYGMLIYKQLEKADMTKAADTLLDNVVLRLERDQTDSLPDESVFKLTGDRHLVHKNLLANAYYLKYKNTIRTDSQMALQYLGQAALYSPSKSKEVVYESFYDRAMLGSKKSYRPVFAKALAANGNKKAGIKVLLTGLKANPLLIDETRSLYDSFMPDSTFPVFLYNAIKHLWKPAAGFALKNLQGNKVSLNDYKGKWLLMDFWGTWCSPCREEMPDVQAFYDNIKAGKLPGLSLLTVATYDSPGRVKTFFKTHHYSLPVVIADDAITKDYEIPGYPAKVLITPDGKWLPIRFGTEWQDIVKKYVSLYREYADIKKSKDKVQLQIGNPD